jgi:hypothetical protein
MSGRPAPERTRPVPSLHDVFDYIRSYGSETHLRTAAIANVELLTIQIELEKLRMSHRYCEDTWFSCPKFKDAYSCVNPAEGTDCNCGADNHNAILDNIIRYLKEVTE